MARGSNKTDTPETVERQWTPRVSAAVIKRLARRADVPAAQKTIVIEAPFTGEVLGYVPHGTPADVAAACGAAREAQREWARRSFAERAAVMLRYHDLVVDNASEILDVIQLEAGKARRHALEEVLDAAIQARYYAHTAAAFLKPQRRQGALPVLTKAWEHHHPRGVIGIITPWNYPFTLGISDAVAALMAGNGVVVKPDAVTPFSALWAAGILDAAGLPQGLVQVVTGRGAELGETLVDCADYLMFTGSTATGRKVAAMAAAHLKDSSMELGGKNAMLVLPDASLRRAVPGAVRGIISGSGQLCVSTERIYVHAAVYDEFAAQLAESLRAVKLGASLTFVEDMGCLIDADHLSKVERHLADAVGKGAEVLAGGKARPEVGPYFFEPTLLAGVSDEMDLCRAETFGPVAAVYRCDSVQEMVDRANDSSYGLNASIWTRDTRFGRELATRLQSGAVNINEAYAATWASAGPMGGFKESGLGRRHGRQGIIKFSEAQTIAVQRLLAIDTPPFLDHQQYATLLRAVVKSLRRLPLIK